jgi:hypothetical protein
MDGCFLPALPNWRPAAPPKPKMELDLFILSYKNSENRSGSGGSAFPILPISRVIQIKSVSVNRTYVPTNH